MFKRVFLFLLTNIAVIAVVSIVLSVFDVSPYLTGTGLNYQSLLIFAAAFGMIGSGFSLLISKWMAKRAYNIQIITQASNDREIFLIQTVQRLATQAGIGMPEVGIYQSPEANAFATGAFKNSALVAVSSGLMDQLDRDELEGVLAHEVAHIANGDMVTMALVQGVVNTFVIFFARIAAFAVVQFLNRNNDNESAVGGLVYYVVSFVFEILFGILASIAVMWFSRHREFHADAGSAKYSSRSNMIKALKALKRLSDRPQDPRGKEFATMKISDKSAMMSLFSTHPSLDDRIEALEKAQY
ncbi:MAG: protease HtpX [Patescibacteria group bacterium]|nr:protease HtpX [Patescibacteria group bacterium]